MAIFPDLQTPSLLLTHHGKIKFSQESKAKGKMETTGVSIIISSHQIQRFQRGPREDQNTGEHKKLPLDEKYLLEGHFFEVEDLRI